MSIFDEVCGVLILTRLIYIESLNWESVLVEEISLEVFELDQ